MKKYRILVIVLSAIIGISVAVIANLNSTCAMAAYTNSITEEDYQVLKDYSLEIAKNSDMALNNKDIDVTMKLNAETLIMDINTTLYGAEAIFPISNLTCRTEDGIMKYDMVIDYDNVTYSEHTEVQSALLYIALSIVIIGAVAWIIYFLLYEIPSWIILKMTKSKS